MDEIRKEKLGISGLTSDRLKRILSSPYLRVKLEALILLQSKDINKLFGLTQEELETYKAKFFDVDHLLSLGKTYVVDYLERTGQKEILKYFLKGEEYTRVRLGLQDRLSNDGKSELYDYLVQKTLIDSADEPDIKTRLQSIRILSREVASKDAKSANKNIIDDLSEMLKDVEL